MPSLSPNKITNEPGTEAPFPNHGTSRSCPPQRGDRDQEAAAELRAVEALNEAKATPAALEAKDRELHPDAGR